MLNFATDSNGRPIGFDPKRLLQERLLIQGASGSGKSYLLRTILESVLDSPYKLPIAVIDPEGEYTTLADYWPCTVVSGDDITDTGAAFALSESAARHRQSYILDLSETDPEARQTIVGEILQSAIDLPSGHWHPRIVAIDEAHELAPQVGKTESRSAIKLLASKGRKRGLCLIAATQRISKLDKDVAAELRNVLVGQTTIESDVKRSLELLALSGQAQNRHILKRLHYQFLGFGPSLPSSTSPIPIRSNTPRTSPPPNGLKTAEVNPQVMQLTHYHRRGGWRGGLTHCLTHTVSNLLIADYLAACLYISDTCDNQMSIAALWDILVKTFGYLDPRGHRIESDNVDHNQSWLWLYWGDNQPLWMSYRQPFSGHQPVDSILRGNQTYLSLLDKLGE